MCLLVCLLYLPLNITLKFEKKREQWLKFDKLGWWYVFCWGSKSAFQCKGHHLRSFIRSLVNSQDPKMGFSSWPMLIPGRKEALNILLRSDLSGWDTHELVFLEIHLYLTFSMQVFEDTNQRSSHPMELFGESSTLGSTTCSMAVNPESCVILEASKIPKVEGNVYGCTQKANLTPSRVGEFLF